MFNRKKLIELEQRIAILESEHIYYAISKTESYSFGAKCIERVKLPYVIEAILLYLKVKLVSSEKAYFVEKVK